MADFLDTSIEYLKGVGPQRADLLKKELQIFTFQDLLQFIRALNLELISADHFMRTVVDTQVSAGPQTLQRRQGSG